MKFLLNLSLVLGLMFAMSSCRKKGDSQMVGVDGDFVSGVPLSDRIEGANFFGGNVTRGQFPAIYFNYDSFDVPESEKSKIQQVASGVGSNTLIVAGFTDDRGTEEYNRGLGERRALAVRQSLIDAGVSAGKIQTVSFGKEMPADSGSGEAAWAKNRRAEFGVVK